MQNNFLSEAKEFFSEAKTEFEKAEREENKVLMRDACEKAWNAVVLATNYLFVEKKLPLPKSSRDRRFGLREQGKQDRSIKDKFLLDRFSARLYNLHEQALYVGYIDPIETKGEIEKVKDYIEDIEKIAKM